MLQKLEHAHGLQDSEIQPNHKGMVNYFRIGDINEYYTSRAPVIYIKNAGCGKILNGDYNGCYQICTH
nr:hypothetical protein [Bullifex porci]